MLSNKATYLCKSFKLIFLIEIKPVGFCLVSSFISSKGFSEDQGVVGGKIQEINVKVVLTHFGYIFSYDKSTSKLYNPSDRMPFAIMLAAPSEECNSCLCSKSFLPHLNARAHLFLIEQSLDFIQKYNVHLTL